MANLDKKQTIDLVGLANSLTDIIINVSEKELKQLGLSKGSQNGLGKVSPEQLRDILLKKEKRYCAAGSPANTLMNASLLGLRTAILGTVGTDNIGNYYEQELKQMGVESWLGQAKGKSGICYVLVTPDYERTCLVNMGIAGNFEFCKEKIRTPKIFHTSGYELASNPKRFMETLNYFKQEGAKISFDLADSRVIREYRAEIEKIVLKTNILFMTEEESRELTSDSPTNALKKMSKICEIVALKKGSAGSIVKDRNSQYQVPVFPIKVVNTCGAGDAYASGFLFAHLRNFSLEECGNMGSYIASRVCRINESHLLPKK